MPPAFPRLLLVLALVFSGPLMAQGTAPTTGPAGPSNPKERVEIERLLRAGQTVEATQRLDRALNADPRNAELRFLKAVMLAEAGRGNEAAEIYTRLTQEYPELPEPYNNLAVIHAARGDFDQARAMLEGALRAQPGYAAAHQNLGDVYVQLAQRAYTQALQADPSNRDIAPKLVQLRELVTPVADAPH